VVFDPPVGAAYDFLIIAVFDFLGKFGIRHKRKAEDTALAYFAFDPDIATMGDDDGLA